MEGERYANLIKRTDDILNSLQKCDDIDEALQLYTSGREIIDQCEKRLAQVETKFNELNSK